MAPPLPGGPAADERRAEAGRRERLLSGAWMRDLNERLDRRFGHASKSARRRVMGDPSTAHNLAASYARQMSRLYDKAGRAACGVEGEQIDAFTSLVGEAGLWEMGRRLQRSVNLVRDGARRVDVVEGAPASLRYTNVPLSCIHVESAADRPDEPTAGVVATPRRLSFSPKAVWTWDVWDIADPAEPPRRVLLAQSGEEMADWRALLSGPKAEQVDKTAEALELDANDGASGANYFERYADGAPFIPVQMYHLERCGMLFSPYEGCEIIEATYLVAEAWHFWHHMLFDASWPQRYGVNVYPVGLESVPADDPASSVGRHIAMDPASLLMLSTRGGQTGQLGQWQAGGDPSNLQMAIQEYVDSLLAELGLAGGAEARSVGGQRSGFAIELDRAAVRESQARQAPAFQRGDEELLRKSAALLNRSGGWSLPEDGWSVTYPGLPLSREEREAVKDRIAALNDLGVSPSRVWNVAETMGIDEAQAEALIAKWDDQARQERVRQVTGGPPDAG